MEFCGRIAELLLRPAGRSARACALNRARLLAWFAPATLVASRSCAQHPAHTLLVLGYAYPFFVAFHRHVRQCLATRHPGALEPARVAAPKIGIACVCLLLEVSRSSPLPASRSVRCPLHCGDASVAERAAGCGSENVWWVEPTFSLAGLRAPAQYLTHPIRRRRGPLELI
ncbi:hypothetical protein OH77DRAFT_1071077 [Trametes cingulata]|nr:hypothetical protein OH77DRAFT_1071077 [Trametes cingulata]